MSVETYRGAARFVECDVFGHLNIAHYPDRFAAASDDLLERLGVDGPARTVSLDVKYLREIRAGDAMVMRSFVLGRAGHGLRLAHTLATEAGEVTTLAEHETDVLTHATVVPAAQELWEPFSLTSWPTSEGALPTGRDRVGDGEGRMPLSAYLRRFSDACLFVLDAIGMTQAYRRAKERGFATFETRLALAPPAPRLGDGLEVTSGVVAVGASSLRLVHVLRTTREHRLVARFLQAGVHFDLRARKSTPFPPELRANAAALRLNTL